MQHKEKTVSTLTKGIEGLFKKNKVDYIKGTGCFKDQNTLKVALTDGGDREIKVKNVIIATGSEPNNLPGGILPIDEKRIVSSTGALSLKEVPKKLIVIGGGVIGLELGSVYNRFGSHVEVVEYADKLLPSFDNEVSNTFLKVLKKTGMAFHFNNKVVGGRQNGEEIVLDVEDVKVIIIIFFFILKFPRAPILLILLIDLTEVVSENRNVVYSKELS